MTSEKHGPVTGSARAANGMIYFGKGVAPIFGDWASGTNGVFAYGPAGGGERVAAVATVAGDS